MSTALEPRVRDHQCELLTGNFKRFVTYSSNDSVDHRRLCGVVCTRGKVSKNGEN